MMKRGVRFLLLCFLSYAGIAQKVELKGRVTEQSSGEPLVSALIKVKNSSLSTLSDMNGNYSLLFEKAGTYTIIVSYIGFREENIKVELKQSQTLDFLMENNLQLEEVVVTSQAPDERVKSLTMGVEKLSAAEIKQMPALMGEVDVIKAIQLLHGVQAASEGG